MVHVLNIHESTVGFILSKTCLIWVVESQYSCALNKITEAFSAKQKKCILVSFASTATKGFKSHQIKKVILLLFGTYKCCFLRAFTSCK